MVDQEILYIEKLIYNVEDKSASIFDETDISYIFIFNFSIACILFLVFLCLRRCRKDKLISNQKNNSYTCLSLIKFLFESNDSLNFNSNKEAFLYLYFLRKTSYLFLKQTPLSLVLAILLNYNILGIKNDDNYFWFSLIKISYVCSNIIIIYFYLRDLYERITKFHKWNIDNSTSIIVKDLDKNLSLEESFSLCKQILQIQNIKYKSIIVVPDKIDLLIESSEKLNKSKYDYYSKTVSVFNNIETHFVNLNKTKKNLLTDEDPNHSLYMKIKYDLEKNLKTLLKDCQTNELKELFVDTNLSVDDFYSNFVKFHLSLRQITFDEKINKKLNEIQVIEEQIKVQINLNEYYKTLQDQKNAGIGYILFDEIKEKEKILKEKPLYSQSLIESGAEVKF